MAAERITADETEGLHALLDSLGPNPEADEMVANYLEFHRRIAACSGNRVLCSLLETLSGTTTRARVWRGLAQAGGQGPDDRRAPGDPGGLRRARDGGRPLVGHGAYRRRRAVAGVGAL